MVCNLSFLGIRDFLMGFQGICEDVDCVVFILSCWELHEWIMPISISRDLKKLVETGDASDPLRKNTSQTPSFYAGLPVIHIGMFISSWTTTKTVSFRGPETCRVGTLFRPPKAPITVEFNGYTCAVAEVMDVCRVLKRKNCFPFFHPRNRLVHSPNPGWFVVGL